MVRSRYAMSTSDVIRVVLLVGLGVLLLVVDPSVWAVIDSGFAAVVYSVGVVLVLSGVTHITRRMLLPKVDAQQLALMALGSPTGAGLAFIGFCILMSTLFVVGVVLLR